MAFPVQVGAEFLPQVDELEVSVRFGSSVREGWRRRQTDQFSGSSNALDVPVCCRDFTGRSTFLLSPMVMNSVSGRARGSVLGEGSLGSSPVTRLHTKRPKMDV